MDRWINKKSLFQRWRTRGRAHAQRRRWWFCQQQIESGERYNAKNEQQQDQDQDLEGGAAARRTTRVFDGAACGRSYFLILFY